MVRLGGQALEANVVIVVLPFRNIGHLQVLLRDREGVAGSVADGEVEVALGASDAGQHHGRGLEVDGVEHPLLTLRALLRLLEQQLADVGGRIGGGATPLRGAVVQVGQREACVDGRDLGLGLVLRVQGL